MKRTMAEAFNEWMKRYTEKPAEFNREFESVGKFLSEKSNGQVPSYGQECEAYLTWLMDGN